METIVESKEEMPISSVDILKPVHNGLRAMIYSVGGKLQTTDFADKIASESLLDELQSEFQIALSTSCILCFLHVHHRAEEASLFPRVQESDSKLISELLQDHHSFLGNFASISKISDELRPIADASQRIEVGKKLALEVNHFFARYLTHLNREDIELVPILQRRLTNEQLIGIASSMAAASPRDKAPIIMKYIFSSLNLEDLAEFIAGFKNYNPQALGPIVAIAQSSVGPDLWAKVKQKVGI